MKFLIIARPRDALFTLPAALARQLIEASTVAINKQTREGRIQESYWIPGAGASVTIKESITAEDLEKDFNDMPIATYYNHEIHPLADYNESIRMITEKLKVVEKLTPGALK